MNKTTPRPVPPPYYAPRPAAPRRAPVAQRRQAAAVPAFTSPVVGKVGTWVGILFLLSLGAFGLGGVASGFRFAAWLVAFAVVGQGLHLVCLVALGVAACFGAVKLLSWVENRFTKPQAGVFCVWVALAGFFAIVGSFLLHIELDVVAGAVISGLSLFSGTTAIALLSDSPSPSPAATERGGAYRRKSDTTHGDARHADDWEVDETLRDNRGGFSPMFKD